MAPESATISAPTDQRADAVLFDVVGNMPEKFDRQREQERAGAKRHEGRVDFLSGLEPHPQECAQR